MTDTVTLTWGSIAAIVSTAAILAAVFMAVIYAIISHRVRQEFQQAEHRWAGRLKPRLDSLDRKVDSRAIIDALVTVAHLRRELPARAVQFYVCIIARWVRAMAGVA